MSFAIQHKIATATGRAWWRMPALRTEVKTMLRRFGFMRGFLECSR